MRVLIVGSGGREHALAWKISQSPLLTKLYCAPGNAGTMTIAESVPILESEIKALADFASKEHVDLTVAGPELPLTMGIVDEFEGRGLNIFGPSKKAAEIEGSKVFAKQFMERRKIPTAAFKVADTPDQAQKILNSDLFSFPLVIKADGLAAGKGAIVCPNLKKAEETVQMMMIQKQFGDSGRNIVIEEFLRGKEVSFIVISDGAKVQPLVTVMDHKAAYDGDKGPNTGGMGTISPSPFLDESLFSEIGSSIVFPTVTQMLEEGRRYKGVLYIGLMITEDGPKVLEYNCRFGDPETQTQVLRMESDLLEILWAITEDNALKKEIKWSRKPSACVVLASGGYPLKYVKGKLIEGLKRVSAIPGITIFHAGTRFEKGEYFTNGGRVLNVCASEETLAQTMDKIYKAISEIHFEAMHYRRDIGATRGEV
jgi:phosphoribosylamine--glycine ligase